MKRRQFLQSLAAVGAAGGLLNRGWSAASAPRRKGTAGKKLVFCFLRGGNDALNTMTPLDETEYNLYAGLRPSIAIPRANLVAVPGNDFFGLHPAMAPLTSIHQDGELSFIHAVGYPDLDRSHFESESYWETSVPGNGLLDGWINRYLQNTSGSGLIRGISVGYNMPHSVIGNLAIPVSGNFGDLAAGMDGDDQQLNALIQNAYTLPPTSGNESLYSTGEKIYQMIDSFADRNIDEYQPENGATYPKQP